MNDMRGWGASQRRATSAGVRPWASFTSSLSCRSSGQAIAVGAANKFLPHVASRICVSIIGYVESRRCLSVDSAFFVQFDLALAVACQGMSLWPRRSLTRMYLASIEGAIRVDLRATYHCISHCGGTWWLEYGILRRGSVTSSPGSLVIVRFLLFLFLF